MNVINLLHRSSKTSANKAALISGIGKSRRILSFTELANEIDIVARELLSRGLKPGDKVLLTVPISIETYVSMLAILKTGLVVMIVDIAHGVAEVTRCLRAYSPAAVVGTRAIILMRFLSPEIRRIPVRIVVGTIRGEQQSPLLTQPRSSEDSALLTFTSGSTGEPKAVIRTHGFLRQQLDVLNRIAEPQASDIDFVAMPLFALFNLANETTSIIPACDMKRPGRANPRALLKQLRADSATTIVASPALLERLADYCLRKRHSIPALRSISTGGGPVSPTLPERLRAVAPNAIIKNIYGSTEAEPIASVIDDDISITDRRAMRIGAGLLVGRAIEGCNVKIVPNNNTVPLGPFSESEFESFALCQGEIGEIVVSGRHVLPGYVDLVRNRETKIEVEKTRWHRTGDAGYFDAIGRLWLVGRCSAAIQDSRGIVYPFQVEYAVGAVRGISRTALISDQGKRILVIETSAKAFNSDYIKAARCIADKQIDRIVTVMRIPMDRRHDAKIDYPALRRLLDGRWMRLRLLFVALVTRTFKVLRDQIVAIQLRYSGR